MRIDTKKNKFKDNIRISPMPTEKPKRIGILDDKRDKSPRRKLGPWSVKAIRCLIDYYNIQQLSDIFNVSIFSISNIIHHKMYKDVGGPKYDPIPMYSARDRMGLIENIKKTRTYKPNRKSRKNNVSPDE